MKESFFQPFKTNISGISLPEKFTFPFYYEPHELSVIASNELQAYLEIQTDFEHNFGLIENQEGLVIGKMFGVLVCQNQVGELGYLWAFSGKLAGVNHLTYFVPTIFDMLHEDSFFRKEEEVLNAINRQIEILENSNELQIKKIQLEKTKTEAATDIQNQKDKIKRLKLERDEKRISFTNLSSTEIKTLELELSEESKKESILLKKMTKYWNFQIEKIQNKVNLLLDEINQLKEERRQKSGALQQKLFAEYSFLNQFGERKSIGEIFNNNPPAGAGECAAPKLLHYAFEHNLKPISMAEFWWGQSPKSEIRKHKQFYPACKSKCEPILLSHMLKGLDMEANPFQENPAEGKNIEVVYEDEILAVINKPAEFLSVPGKIISDSVYQRVKELYPNATGPVIVHRLDMSTSGLMLIAKDEETYVKLQSQFIKRTIKKRYVALLDGILEENEGFIDLPLRVDLDDRPRQLVCYEHGKPAQTKWEKIEIRNNQTLVYFYPITGRTHQLRVHASHELGLNTPIVGDDLYGTKGNRLHLHAEQLIFEHPISKEQITLKAEIQFYKKG
ncbi:MULTISPECIES: RluA family pseudouridine synthase [unclassified Flavobacterium]|uniref:RluA family pseudouridine synthase n=1 Tax=unclassified Flavobacterium TaxID=196869 RepID=UPI0012914806|nr:MULTISPECIES: RluA family pseudouridine synthase [unclassified Flavobacterium]MQP53622.1 RNA pseudouridine synthase [Flavobacterium sp. LMO9]MQP63564.1 RNA pseudouridine synthase [Flavobacterium sp. LMO6]